MTTQLQAPERALPTPDRLRLVIFDCDGVLFDSWRANVAFYNAVLAAAGQPALDDAGEHLCHRYSSPQLYAALFGSEPTVLARVTEIAATIDYTPFFDLMVPARDLETSLGRLAAHCPLALATNRGRTVAGLIARFGLQALLPIHVGILDVEHPKPTPDMLLRCLELAAVAPEATVYVGDTELDHAAAAACGIAYVGVGPNSGTTRVVREVRELPALLLG